MMKYVLILVACISRAFATFEPVPAKERLDLLERKISENPKFSPHDEIEELYQDHYFRDRQFIEQQLQENLSFTNLKSELDALDHYVQEKNGQLSFIDYAYIGMAWSDLLSKSDIKDGELSHFIESTTWHDKHKETKYASLNGINFHYCQLFPLIHVSTDGLVPLDVINRGLGFYDSYHQPQSALFFGVATNKRNNFDNHKQCLSSTLFIHDYLHAQYAFMTNVHRDLTQELDAIQKYIDKIALLRKFITIETNAHMLSYQEAQEVEWAFFNIFHEEPFGLLITQQETLQSYLRKLMDKFSISKSMEPMQYTSAEAQNLINTAASLNLNTNNIPQEIVDEFSTCDSWEKVKPYLSAQLHLYEGYQYLLSCSSVFDS